MKCCDCGVEIGLDNLPEMNGNFQFSIPYCRDCWAKVPVAERAECVSAWDLFLPGKRKRRRGKTEAMFREALRQIMGRIGRMEVKDDGRPIEEMIKDIEDTKDRIIKEIENTKDRIIKAIKDKNNKMREIEDDEIE
jgi:hypothetical protein